MRYYVILTFLWMLLLSYALHAEMNMIVSLTASMEKLTNIVDPQYKK